MERIIGLCVVSPQGTVLEAKCDSIVLPAADGGLIGVRYGHTKAVFALSAGKIKAMLGGRTVAELSIPGGYARIERDEVSVITENSSDTGEGRSHEA